MVSTRVSQALALAIGTMSAAGCLSIVGADKDYRQADDGTGAASGDGGAGLGQAGAGAGGPAACGNGIKEGEEECDGSDLGQATCASTVGAVSSGTLVCSNDCTLDPGGCSVCGDGVIDDAEECDSDVFGTADCTSELGEPAGGSLTCSDSCEAVSGGCRPCGAENFIVMCNDEWSCPQNSVCAGMPFGSVCNCLPGLTATTCDGAICGGNLCYNTLDWYCH